MGKKKRRGGEEGRKGGGERGRGKKGVLALVSYTLD